MEDPTCFPVRGQVMRLKAPWVKHVYMFDELYYVIPNVDTIVIGGTQQRGDYSVTVDAADSNAIRENVGRFLPSLRTAPIAYEWVRLHARA